MKKSELNQTCVNSRNQIMLMLMLTSINVILTLLDTGMMFMFTAYFPYIAAVYADGILSFIKPIVLIVGVALPLLLLLLSWFFAGKGKYRWFNVALLLTALDTVFMVVMFINIGFDPSLIVDYIIGTAFHVYMLYMLYRGASAGKKLSSGDYFDDTALTGEDAVADNQAQ